MSQSVAEALRSTSDSGPPSALRRAPIDAVDQHRQLCRGQRQRLTGIDVRRPEKDALLEPLGEEAEACPIPEYDLDEVGLPAPEHEEMAREGILPQHALDQHSEPVDALAHVGVAKGQVYLQALRKQGHDACASALSAASQGP